MLLGGAAMVLGGAAMLLGGAAMLLGGAALSALRFRQSSSTALAAEGPGPLYFLFEPPLRFL